jgi:hypothetical protein
MLSRIERRIRISGFCVALGLLILAATLTQSHPLAFVAFLLVGAPLIGLGMLFFLWGLASGTRPAGAEKS